MARDRGLDCVVVQALARDRGLDCVVVQALARDRGLDCVVVQALARDRGLDCVVVQALARDRGLDCVVVQALAREGGPSCVQPHKEPPPLSTWGLSARGSTEVQQLKGFLTLYNKVMMFMLTKGQMMRRGCNLVGVPRPSGGEAEALTGRQKELAARIEPPASRKFSYAFEVRRNVM
ncbi:unnamed protein product [Boreogadus saida]